jgi:hypothetical protein
LAAAAAALIFDDRERLVAGMSPAIAVDAADQHLAVISILIRL